MKRKDNRILVPVLLSFLVVWAIGAAEVNAQELQQDAAVWDLQRCIEHAKEHNLSLKRSHLDVEDSRVSLIQSKMSRVPTLNGSASNNYSWGRSIDPTTNRFIENQRINTVGLGLNSSVPLFNGFRIRNTIKQNQLSTQASIENQKDQENTVILNIITFYTNVIFNQELYENAKLQLSSSENMADMTRKQVDVGALPKANLLDILSQKASNEVNVVNQQNALNLSRLQLKQALQLPAEEDFDIVVPELEVEPTAMEQDAENIYTIAKQHMPMIKSAELFQQSTRYGLASARGTLYPTLSLNAGLNTNYSSASTDFISDGTFVPRTIPNPENPDQQLTVFESFGFATAADGTPIVSPRIESIQGSFGGSFETRKFSTQLDENLRYFVGLSLNIPILNGFSARASVQRATISQQRAEITYQEAENNLRQTIESAYTDVVAAFQTYTASQRQVEAQEESFRITQKRYELNAINFVDFKVAENDFFRSKSDLIRAKYDYIFKQKVLDFYQNKPLEF